MYQDYFGFSELPFSIVPNSRFLYLSQRHREAITHIQAGLGEGGGFALLTGEVGTGKTTVAKAILSVMKENTQAGLILNPTFSAIELLEAICDEYSIDYQPNSSLKSLNDNIYQFLLSNHAQGRQTFLVIDEAQHLSADVLEQLRLLTNLETNSRKLLKVLLIGQPELQHKLKTPELRQLAQRITGRYHLLPLSKEQIKDYLQFRLGLVGGELNLFSKKSIALIYQYTQGIPRLINLVCDASLKQAYQLGEKKPSTKTVGHAGQLILSLQGFSTVAAQPQPRSMTKSVLSLSLSLVLATGLGWLSYHNAPVIFSSTIDSFISQSNPVSSSSTNEVEQAELPAELLTALSSQQNRDEGIGDLYRAWGYRASVMDKFCVPSEESMFRCESLTTDLEALRRLNFPALLTLNVADKTTYAVLSSITQHEVVLTTNTESISLPIEQLEKFWSGRAHIIWQAYWRENLKLGAKGKQVAKLDEHISSAIGESSNQSDEFNSELKRKVELFQRWQSLDVDGIAGQQTLQRLERLTQKNAPRLISEKDDA